MKTENDNNTETISAYAFPTLTPIPAPPIETVADGASLRTRGRRSVPLQFTRMANGCLICTSHRIHPTHGCVMYRGTDGRTEALARYVYRQLRGPDAVPPKHNVIQTCGRKACCAPEHLATMPERLKVRRAYDVYRRTRHDVRDRARRWAAEHPEATLGDVAERFDVTTRTAQRWKKAWRQEAAAASTLTAEGRAR